MTSLHNVTKQIHPGQFPELPRLPNDIESHYGIVFRSPLSQERDELRTTLERLATASKIDCDTIVLDDTTVLTTAPENTFYTICDQFLSETYASVILAWEKPRDIIPFNECSEKLIFLPEFLGSHQAEVLFSKRPFHTSCGSFAGKPRLFWCREGLANCFLVLTQALNAIDIIPHIEDAYRPLEVQYGLFQRRVELVRAEFPEWGMDRVLKEVSTKTAITPAKAAHMSGAALDFTLYTRNGEMLPLGNQYPEGGTRVLLHFPYLTWDQYRTRQIFLHACLFAGLFPYFGEDWHASYGDGLHAVAYQMKEIRYGPLASISPTGIGVPIEERLLRTSFDKMSI